MCVCVKICTVKWVDAINSICFFGLLFVCTWAEYWVVEIGIIIGDIYECGEYLASIQRLAID